MTRDEILALCSKVPDVGSVKHADFVDYIVVVESRRKIPVEQRRGAGDEWQTVENVYLAVDGKLAMANADHRKQGKRLDFAEPKVLIDTADQLTLQVTVTSEIYGVRHGIATSRKKNGTKAEKDWPWEVAETSAIGRALAAMGYGLLPGAGLASAEDILLSSSKDMLRMQAGNEPPDKRENGSLTHAHAACATGNGHPVCSLHQVALQIHGKGWAHRMQSGGWCYGNASRTASTRPTAVAVKDDHTPTQVT